MKRLSILLAIIASLTLVSGSALAAPAKTQFRTFGTGLVTKVAAEGPFTIVNDAGEYGGVYVKPAKDAGAIPVGSFAFSFNYTGTVTGGSPRFSIPVDGGYAFIDAANCGDTGTVDMTCPVYYGSDPVYANWAAFVAVHAGVVDDIPFVIADVEGTYVISNIVLGS